MGDPESHGSSGGIESVVRQALKNAKSMNFSAPKIAGESARTPTAQRKAPAKIASSKPPCEGSSRSRLRVPSQRTPSPPRAHASEMSWSMPRLVVHQETVVSASSPTGFANP